MKSILAFFSILMLSFTLRGQVADPEAGLNASSLEAESEPLNNPENADAYSWLSADGLRIYYTRDHSGDEVWKATRKSINEPFTNPVSIPVYGFAGVNEIFSSWLTEDEKQLYFVMRKNSGQYSTSLYKASYDADCQCFKNPEQINLYGAKSEAEDIFISGPSLSPDLTQLFVYYSDRSGKDRIACYEGKDRINYTFRYFLNNQENYCPGSLADRGLTFYLTLRNHSHTLVKLTRPDLRSKFGNPQYLALDSAISEGRNYYQPHVNTRLGILAITVGQGTWDSNDLVLMKIPTRLTYEAELLSKDTVLTAEVQDEQIVQFDDYAAVDPDLVVLPTDPEQAQEDTLSFDTDEALVPQPVSNLPPTASLEFMPNPASASFTIRYEIPETSAESITLEILDLQGRKVKQQELSGISGEAVIDISGLSEGMYYFRIICSNYCSDSRKLLVKR